jgi:fructose-specific phosphotransferase system component IIB
VAIPTIGEAPGLGTLVRQLLDDDVDEILLLVNRPGINLPDVVPSHRIIIMETEGPGIYPGWNTAIRYAAISRAKLAILNDDIKLRHERSISLAASIMLDYEPQDLVVLGFNYGIYRNDPEVSYVNGSYRNGGVGGFAFMVDSTRCPMVDEQFEWWGGDDDLFIQVEKAGHKLGIANTLTVDHLSETTARNHLWTYEARLRDRDRFVAKYGRTAAW